MALFIVTCRDIKLLFSWDGKSPEEKALFTMRSLCSAADPAELTPVGDLEASEPSFPAWSQKVSDVMLVLIMHVYVPTPNERRSVSWRLSKLEWWFRSSGCNSLPVTGTTGVDATLDLVDAEEGWWWRGRRALGDFALWLLLLLWWGWWWLWGWWGWWWRGSPSASKSEATDSNSSSVSG